MLETSGRSIPLAPFLSPRTDTLAPMASTPIRMLGFRSSGLETVRYRDHPYHHQDVGPDPDQDRPRPSSRCRVSGAQVLITPSGTHHAPTLVMIYGWPRPSPGCRASGARDFRPFDTGDIRILAAQVPLPTPLLQGDRLGVGLVISWEVIRQQKLKGHSPGVIHYRAYFRTRSHTCPLKPSLVWWLDSHHRRHLHPRCAGASSIYLFLHLFFAYTFQPLYRQASKVPKILHFEPSVDA